METHVKSHENLIFSSSLLLWVMGSHMNMNTTFSAKVRSFWTNFCVSFAAFPSLVWSRRKVMSCVSMTWSQFSNIRMWQQSWGPWHQALNDGECCLLCSFTLSVTIYSCKNHSSICSGCDLMAFAVIFPLQSIPVTQAVCHTVKYSNNYSNLVSGCDV